MQAQEALRKVLKKIAASVNGQQENVRTVYGRQVNLIHQSTPILMLPQLESNVLQDQDPGSTTFGKFYTMVDIDAVDGDSVIK